MNIKYVLDTHTLIWAVRDPARLGVKARRIVESAEAGEIGIPSPVIMELGRLIHADAFTLHGRPSDVFAAALNYHGVLPMSLNAAISAPVLRLPHSDPYDRLIVATALELDVPLITKDGNITDSGIVRVIW